MPENCGGNTDKAPMKSIKAWGSGRTVCNFRWKAVSLGKRREATPAASIASLPTPRPEAGMPGTTLSGSQKILHSKGQAGNKKSFTKLPSN
jgi:hypothetical protein